MRSVLNVEYICVDMNIYTYDVFNTVLQKDKAARPFDLEANGVAIETYRRGNRNLPARPLCLTAISAPVAAIAAPVCPYEAQ